MRRKQNLANALGFEKENWGLPRIFQLQLSFNLKKNAPYIALYFVKLRPKKNSGLNGIRTTDLCESGAGRNKCNDWAFFDIFKFSLKERFRGQKTKESG